MLIKELPYHPDTKKLFSHFLQEHHSILLDSNFSNNNNTGYDIISANPQYIFHSINNKKYINNNLTKYSPEQFVEKYNKQYNCNKLPFIGGAIGIVSFDYSYNKYQIPRMIPKDLEYPEIIIGIYNWAIVINHSQKKIWYVNQQQDYNHYKWVKQKTNMHIVQTNNKINIKLKKSILFSQYEKSFIKSQYNIKQGQYYQINLSQRFENKCTESSWDIYNQYINQTSANFCAFYTSDFGDIICFSPERFLQINDNKIYSQPIKGTINNHNVTLNSIKNLLNSEKNQAENLMIVDLIRNDLYKFCDPKSIQVEYFCKTLALYKLLHLESKISGNLKNGTHPFQAFLEIFPGGSVTGAPKINAIKYTEQLEYYRRNIFCGSIFYLSANKKLDSNIIIRSLLKHNNRIYGWSGGAITNLSKIDEEYTETINKMQQFL